MVIKNRTLQWDVAFIWESESIATEKLQRFGFGEQMR